MSSRLKREECKRTKHDSVFSKWQILIGPRDWEDHALGKDGVERYRIHNLPQCSSCPGLYELGISEIPTEGRKSRAPPSYGIVAVYVGQADNVRARLQQYGRTGSHLEMGKLIAYANNYKGPCLVETPGLFKETFSKGYSILFRWAPMIDKKEAKMIESKLLRTFDYPWNTRANGDSRRDDALKKISSTRQSIPKVLFNFQEWKQLTFNKKVGIKISGSVPPDKSGSSNYFEDFLIPLVRKVSRNQPRPNEGGEVLISEYDICGVANGDGSICRRKPVLRNKRCLLHKGMRITSNGHITIKEVSSSTDNSSLVSLPIEDSSLRMELPCNGAQQCQELWEISPTEDLHTKDESIGVEHDHSEGYQICGVLLRDGNVCRSKPFQGRQRCEDHKGMRVTGSVSMTTKKCLAKEISSATELDPFEDNQICGEFLGVGNVCQTKPFQGRKRCEDHEGMRVTGIISMPTRECSTKGIISSNTERDSCEEYQICGVFFADGSVCRSKPFPGRKRCEDHKGMRVNGIISRTAGEFSITNITPSEELDPCEGNEMCGVLLGDGNVCRSRPSRGRKRCEDHKGMRVNGIISSTFTECSITEVPSRAELYHYQEYQICGVSLANGNVCQRMPVQGRKRCEAHKGKRVT